MSTARKKPKGQSGKLKPGMPGTPPAMPVAPYAEAPMGQSRNLEAEQTLSPGEPVELVEEVDDEVGETGSKKQSSTRLKKSPVQAQSYGEGYVSSVGKEETHGSLAQSFLQKAKRNFEDRPAPRLPEERSYQRPAEQQPEDEQHPKPPSAKVPIQPRPPTPDRLSAKELSDGSKATALRTSQSAGALGSSSPPASRRTYGGELKGGKFIRAHVDSVDALTEADKQALKRDMEELKAKKMLDIEEKRKKHEFRREKEKSLKEEKFRLQHDEQQSIQSDRKRENAKGVRTWLMRKDDEIAAKKKKESEMMMQVMEKEHAKNEAAKKLELDRQADRERRLRIHEKQKAKLASQLVKSREAKMAMPIPMEPNHAMSAQLDPHLPMPTQLDSPQSMEVFDPQRQAMPRQQRVVHRHIHHHVHYHEGGDCPSDAEDEGAMETRQPFTSLQEQRQMEMASEARVRAQLEAQEAQDTPTNRKLAMMQSASADQLLHNRLPSVDPNFDSCAETPTMHHAVSMGHVPMSYGDNQFDMTRTQQAFRGGQSLPALDVQDMGRRNGLVQYSKNVERAFGSYGDSGRPRAIRPHAGMVGMGPPSYGR